MQLITAYAFTDNTGFRRIGGCLSACHLQEILNGYSQQVQNLHTEAVPKTQFDEWRDKMGSQHHS